MTESPLPSEEDAMADMTGALPRTGTGVWFVGARGSVAGPPSRRSPAHGGLVFGGHDVTSQSSEHRLAEQWRDLVTWRRDLES